VFEWEARRLGAEVYSDGPVPPGIICERGQSQPCACGACREGSLAISAQHTHQADVGAVEQRLLQLRHLATVPPSLVLRHIVQHHVCAQRLVSKPAVELPHYHGRAQLAFLQRSAYRCRVCAREQAHGCAGAAKAHRSSVRSAGPRAQPLPLLVLPCTDHARGLADLWPQRRQSDAVLLCGTSHKPANCGPGQRDHETSLPRRDEHRDGSRRSPASAHAPATQIPISGTWSRRLHLPCP
jgi:hypothetical protein